MKTGRRKILYFLTMGLLLLFFVIVNYDTPLFDDDLYIGHHQTIVSLYNQAYGDYMHWNGRAVGQTFWRILSSSNQLIASILIAIVSVALIVLVYYFGKNKKQLSYSCFNLTLSSALIFLFAPVLGQTMFWRAGAGNYLFTTTLILFIILYFYQWYHQKEPFKNKLWFVLPLLSFLAGWSNENTSGGALLIILVYTLLGKYYKGLKCTMNQLISLVTYLLGYLFLVLAPGNAIRTKQTMSPSWFDETAFVHFKSGFIAVTKSLIHHYFVLILLIVILIFVYFLRADFEKSIESLIWFGSGMATLYALALAPLGQDGGRSFFGGAIFLIISLLLLINNNNELETGGKSHTVIIIFSLILILLAGIKTALGVIDAHKSNEALRARYSYIENLSDKEKKQVVQVPALNHYPSKSFSVDYGLEEIHTDNPHVFPNEGYNIYFKLNGILLKE